MYLPRDLQNNISKAANNFKVILVNGARQVGKSTMLQHLFPDLEHLVFDAVQDLYNANQDPELFIKNFPAPIILDEIQYAPNILSAIKRKVDNNQQKGQYLLTGSQNISILKTISETMAGRVGIFNLSIMTPFEKNNLSSQRSWFYYYLNKQQLPTAYSIMESEHTLYQQMLNGGMPGLLEIDQEFLHNYFNSYIQTYIDRDVRTLDNIRSVAQFSRFLSLLAALTSQEINFNQLGRELDINPATAKRWLDLLQHSFQWRMLPAYSGNAIKRLSKKPKGIIRDTGIACHLLRINSATSLASYPQVGAIFESFCCNYILDILNNFSINANAYHWRTNAGAEVDLIIELNGQLLPIEIKLKTKINKRDVRSLQSFQETYHNQIINNGHGKQQLLTAIIIYAGEKILEIQDNIYAVPWNCIV